MEDLPGNFFIQSLNTTDTPRWLVMKELGLRAQRCCIQKVAVPVSQWRLVKAALGVSLGENEYE